MKLSTKSRYAVMAMADIASYSNGRPVSLQSIADRQDVALNYLEQIFLKLKKADLVSSIKGPGGGYTINGELNEITVSKIIIAMESSMRMTRCDSSKGCTNNNKTKCLTHSIWQGLTKTIMEYFDSISLSDVVQQTSTCTTHKSHMYFDHNATTNMIPEAKKAMASIDQCYNPSSVHALGREARAIVENARKDILHSLNAKEDTYNLIFTSGGTEANNLAIKGLEQHKLYISSIEHLSILAPAKNAQLLTVNKDGLLDLVALEKHLSKSTSPALVSVMLANNETGVIQDIKEIARIVHKYNAIIHTDASQAFCKINVDVTDLDVDLITISSHKIGGPLGAGALIIKKGINILSLIEGGSQEKKLRAGTENINAILGFAEAAKHIDKSINRFKEVGYYRDYIENEILSIDPMAKIYCKNTPRIPNTICVAMPNVLSEMQQIHFDLDGVAISAGAACSSGKIEPSHVLLAMDSTDSMINNAIRISLGHDTTRDEVIQFVKTWQRIYSTLNKNTLTQENLTV